MTEKSEGQTKEVFPVENISYREKELRNKKIEFLKNLNETQMDNLKAMDFLQEVYPHAFESKIIRNGMPVLITKNSMVFKKEDGSILPIRVGVDVKEKDRQMKTTNFVISPKGIAEFTMDSDGFSITKNSSTKYEWSFDNVFESEGQIQYEEMLRFYETETIVHKADSVKNFEDITDKEAESIKNVLKVTNERHKPKIDKIIEKLKP